MRRVCTGTLVRCETGREGVASALAGGHVAAPERRRQGRHQRVPPLTRGGAPRRVARSTPPDTKRRPRPATLRVSPVTDGSPGAEEIGSRDKSLWLLSHLPGITALFYSATCLKNSPAFPSLPPGRCRAPPRRRPRRRRARTAGGCGCRPWRSRSRASTSGTGLLSSTPPLFSSTCVCYSFHGGGATWKPGASSYTPTRLSLCRQFH